MRPDGLRLIETFELPWSVQITKNKKFSLNLNEYRNAHYQVLSKAKRIFNESVIPPRKKGFDHIHVEYIIMRKGKRKIDTMNVVSIADKFFLDFLVLWGVIPDDHSGIVSHMAPRVETVKTYNHIVANVYVEDEREKI